MKINILSLDVEISNMVAKIEVHGYCDPRFKAVKEAFAKNYKEDLEVGSSCAVTLNGKFVVDIWAGYKDAAKTKPWEKDTIVTVYSSTKVMTAICIHMLVDRGLLDVEKPVAKYWPEFAQAGKENLPVKYLLSHSSGLPGWDVPLKEKDLYDWNKITSLLAAQKPWHEPGMQEAYHSDTFGYLLGHLVLKITGKSLGTFFREEVAEPLNADFHIGLPKAHDSRVAELIPPKPPAGDGSETFDPESIAYKVLLNPLISPKSATSREWLAAEIPASNGQGNARSMARIGSVVACGGEVDGIRLFSPETLEKAIQEQIYKTDLVLGGPIRYGLGWGLVSKENPVSPNSRTCYWGGWGGSRLIMDLDAKLCFAYAMNKMIQSLTGDPRTNKLGKAVYDCM